MIGGNGEVIFGIGSYMNGPTQQICQYMINLDIIKNRFV